MPTARGPPRSTRGGTRPGTYSPTQRPQEEASHSDHQWEYRQNHNSTSVTDSSKHTRCSNFGRKGPPISGGSKTSKKSFSRLARDFARNYAHKLAQNKAAAAASAAAKEGKKEMEASTG